MQRAQRGDGEVELVGKPAEVLGGGRCIGTGVVHRMAREGFGCSSGVLLKGGQALARAGPHQLLRLPSSDQRSSPALWQPEGQRQPLKHAVTQGQDLAEICGHGAAEGGEGGSRDRARQSGGDWKVVRDPAFCVGRACGSTWAAPAAVATAAEVGQPPPQQQKWQRKQQAGRQAGGQAGRRAGGQHLR